MVHRGLRYARLARGEGAARRVGLRRFLHQEHALAGGLSVEQAIGLFRLVELPVMGEQAVDIDFSVDDELGAFGLADGREGPGGDDRQLLAQHVGTDVDRHIVAFADKAHRAPHLTLRTAAIRPSGWLDVSRVKSAPPCVRSLIAPIGSFERGLTVSQAPNSFARSSRSGLTSRAMTRAPIAAASWVADRPTGPWPNNAIVSLPESFSRRSAP